VDPRIQKARFAILYALSVSLAGIGRKRERALA
jgi:hypothetical protein